jgi:hypothetical protein
MNSVADSSFTFVVSKKKNKKNKHTTVTDAVTYSSIKKGTSEYDDYVSYMTAIQCDDCQYAAHCQRHRCR